MDGSGLGSNGERLAAGRAKLDASHPGNRQRDSREEVSRRDSIYVAPNTQADPRLALHCAFASSLLTRRANPFSLSLDDTRSIAPARPSEPAQPSASYAHRVPSRSPRRVTSTRPSAHRLPSLNRLPSLDHPVRIGVLAVVSELVFPARKPHASNWRPNVGAPPKTPRSGCGGLNANSDLPLSTQNSLLPFL